MGCSAEDVALAERGGGGAGGDAGGDDTAAGYGALAAEAGY